MTLIIEELDEKFLPIFKELAKLTKAKLKKKRTSADIARELKEESNELEMLYKEGKIKAYDDVKQMHKDILNEV